MAARRSQEEETVKQCTDCFVRERKYWQRLVEKRKEVTQEELRAKLEIIEAIFRVGSSAATKANSGQLRENLMWDYNELSGTLELYIRMVTVTLQNTEKANNNQ